MEKTVSVADKIIFLQGTSKKLRFQSFVPGFSVLNEGMKINIIGIGLIDLLDHRRSLRLSGVLLNN